MTLQDWQKELEQTMPRVLTWRRYLHQHPELGMQETNTRDYILARLKELGIPAVTFEGCNAVMGVLQNGQGPCVALRADMDALPMQEPEGLPFASCNPGVMHACGHDVHMALALGSAAYLSDHREKWQGTVKWLFEPAEESYGGGQWMVAQGCMDNPAVDVVMGQHINPNMETGVFYSRPGYVSGSSDELLLTVRGKSSHGAYPENGVDAIVITAQIITALQTLISRTVSPFDPAVITFGTIEGGKANNIVCGEVKLRGTLRTLNDTTRAGLKERLQSIIQGVAQSMGGEAELNIRPSYGAVYNHDGYYAVVENEAREILGDEKIVRRSAASLGVESFCYFLDHTPGVYFDIGCGVSTALHTPTIMIDEQVLTCGVALQCASAMALLKKINA